MPAMPSSPQRQALLRANVPLLVVVAIVLDAGLILAGGAGFGAVVRAHAQVLTFISWAGAIFIACYGLLAIKRAFHPTVLIPSQGAGLSPMQAVRVLLMVSLLNPHVYLDTVVLVGGIAGRYAGSAHTAFILGAIAASAVCSTSTVTPSTSISSAAPTSSGQSTPVAATIASIAS